MDTRPLSRLLDPARTVLPVGPVSAGSGIGARHGSATIVHGEVAEQLALDRFRVLVDGRSLTLRLPPETRTGERVALRVIGDAVHARAALADAQGDGPVSTVSRTGALLGALLARPAPAPAPAPQMQPVVPTPPAATADLAGPLARAIERSGLFYESHQARWVAGEFALERLREEPQAGVKLRAVAADAAPMPKPALASPATPPASANGHAPGLPAPTTPDPAASDPLPQARVLATTDATTDAPAAPEAADAIAARETLPIVRQQLETLEQRALSWMGEIWPGQAMRWEIAAHGENGGTAPEPPEWDTAFELTLPHLGGISARLVLDPTGVRVLLDAQDAAAAASMRSALPALARALADAGVTARDLQVRQDHAGG